MREYSVVRVITAATFAHESSGNPIKVIHQSINTIKRRGKEQFESKYETSFSKPVEQIIKSVNTLGVLSTATLSLIDHDKRRVTRVDLHKVITNVLHTFDPFLKGRDITTTVDLAPEVAYLRGSEAAIESILTNLLNNSVTAFEHAGTNDRALRIATEIEDGHVTITVEDNGPGIVGILKRDMWLPGITTKPQGTGLGLTIVRDTVTDLGGDVDAIEHGDLGGATLIVKLPITNT